MDVELAATVKKRVSRRHVALHANPGGLEHLREFIGVLARAVKIQPVQQFGRVCGAEHLVAGLALVRPDKCAAAVSRSMGECGFAQVAEVGETAHFDGGFKMMRQLRGGMPIVDRRLNEQHRSVATKVQQRHRASRTRVR